MRAILMDGYGDADVLYASEIPHPVPGVGEVVVRVTAIGVNPADCKYRAGLFAAYAPLRFPHVLGYDIAGVLEEDAVDNTGGTLPAGSRVAANLHATRHGAYAEYAAVLAGSLAVIPDGVSDAQAAAVPTPGLTGVQMIEEQLDVQAGEAIVVTGATGAVGRFALGAAVARGARVIAAVRGGYLGEATRLGATEVVVLGRATGIGPVDAVADTVGGPEVAAIARHVRAGGRISTVATDPIDPAGLAAVPAFFALHPDGARLALLLRGVAAGRAVPPIAHILRLEQVRQAHRMLEAGGVAGKIILVP